MKSCMKKFIQDLSAANLFGLILDKQNAYHFC